MERVLLSKMTDNFVHHNSKEIKYFKQLNIYKNIKLPHCYRRVTDKNIEAVDTDLKLISCKISDTYEGMSIEGQNLSGKKLVIAGGLDVKIYFKPQSIHRIHMIIPFSAFIVLPAVICEKQDIKLCYFIEDVICKRLIRRRLFISVTFLLKYEEDV